MNELKKLFAYFKTNFFFTKLTNPEDVSSPIVEALDKLEETITGKEKVDVSDSITKRLDKLIDKKLPETKEFPDLKPQLEEISRTVKKEIGKINFKTPKVVVKNDLNKFLALFKSKKDAKDVTDRLDRILERMDSPKELESYADILAQIAKGLENTDLIESVRRLKQFEIPEGLIHDGRLKVNVDRAGGGFEPAGLATSAKQDDIISALGGSTGTYVTLMREDSGDSDIIYIGKATTGTAQTAGTWQIQRMDTNTLLDVEWCDGDEGYNNVFSDRESLSYS